jgi:hypothetical protein
MIEYKVTKITPKKSPYFANNHDLKGVESESDLAQSVRNSAKKPSPKFSPKDSKKALMKRKRKASVVSSVSKHDSSQSIENAKGKSKIVISNPLDTDESGSDLPDSIQGKKMQETQMIVADKSELHNAEYFSIKQDHSKKLDLQRANDGYSIKQSMENQIVHRKDNKNQVGRGGFQSPGYKFNSKYDSLVKRGYEKAYASSGTSDELNDKPSYNTKMEKLSSKRIWTQVDMDTASDDNCDHSCKLPHLKDTAKSQKKTRLSDTTRHQSAVKPLELVPQEDFISSAIANHIKVNHKPNLKMLSYQNKQFLNRLIRLQANEAQELNEFTMKLKKYVKTRYVVQESD